MVEVKLGRGALLLGAILAVGYIIIFISIMIDPGAGPKFNMMQTELAELQLKLDRKIAAEKNALHGNARGAVVVGNDVRASRPGVIILGMHRSGTSVVGGLMSKMGLQTGGPLIGAAEDNEKGFFERIDVVLQNDALMEAQNVHYAFHTSSYNALQGLKDVLNKKDNSKFFNEGKRGLAFLNDPKSYPWMLKDPRLCLTIRTWLPLLNFVPAVLFIYRHPFDVTLSMHKRATEHFKMGFAMKLWYVYNKKAITQSGDLCRVVGSHKKIMAAPQKEFDRIYDELHTCGIQVPHKLKSTDISDFIDVKLQHGKNGQDVSCSQDYSTLIPPVAWAAEEPDHLNLYRESMRVFCAMEDGSAFREDFKWDESIEDL